MRGLLLSLLLLSPGLQAALGLPVTDAYGYTASVQSYAWTEISGTGTPVTTWAGGADDGSALINIPFNFRFYGAPYNKVAVSSNGYLQFGSQSSYYGVNCLGANLDPRNVAALYWMDLNPGAGGAVYSEVQGAPGSRVFIVQFQAVPRTVGGGSVTAQWRLYEADNSLEAAWASTASSGSGADAVAGLRSGFDCPNRTSLPLSCQQAVLSDNLSVRFQYPAGEPLCGTPTITPTYSISPTFSTSPTFSASPTVTATYSDSPTATVTPTASPSFSASPSRTDSATASPSSSVSPTPSHSPTSADTATATPTASASPSPSVTRTPLVLTDAFGYVAVQAPLAWEDISGTGAPITAWAGGADDGSALVDLPVGWLFRFYGADYTKVAVSSNGYLQFGSSSSAFGHSCLDAGASPFGLAALFWKDLDLDLGGDVRWQILGSAPNRRLIIQFSGVPAQGGGPGLTAQAALFEGSHALSFRYLSSLGAGASASAGLRSFFECPNRTGLSFSCNAAGLPDGLQFDVAYPASEPACGTPTYTATPTSSATPTASPSPSPTATPSSSPSPTATDSPSATATPSVTESPTISPSWTISATFSVSPTFSASPSITRTYSASPTFSATATISPTVTISPSFTVSPTDTDTPTVTETATISPTHTDSPTVTATPTETASFTVSPTYSDSPTVTETATISPTHSVSPTVSASSTITPTGTLTASSTPSFTVTETSTPTPTSSATPTATPSVTRTASTTRTVSPTPTFTLFPPAPKPACIVLGQPSFITNTAAPGPSGMNLPDGVALDTRVLPFRAYVADRNNHRVLIWNDAAGLVNGSPADGVIGQADLAEVGPNRNGAVAADTLREPSGLALDPLTGDLWVADTFNHRVLRFAAPIALSGAAADRVLGQGGSFSSSTPSLGGVHAGSLNFPAGLSWSPLGQLAVADSGHHRALIFNNPAASASADSAWGQGLSLNLGAADQGGAISAGGLNTPEGVLLGSLELWIADSANHRVLRVGTWPSLSGTANLVLGQPNFSSGSPNQGFSLPDPMRLNRPRGLAQDGGGRVVVADHGNHRVVAFEPVHDGFADQWWGQPSLYSAGAGAGQDLMNEPGAVFAWAGTLAVADTANHRVLIYGCGSGIAAATATPSRTITATHTPTATHSPTVTPSFTVTQSHTRTETRTASETRTVSATATETATRSATLSVTPTRTITRTFTPVATATVTLTLTQSLTPYPRTESAIITWPNPAPLAGGRACIGFPPAADVRVELYDRLGQPVRSLDAGQIDRAGGFACWDLRNREGDAVRPGRYFVRVLLDGQAKMGRLTLR